MSKPTGARCNLHCDYCFFLDKADLYPDSDFHMPDEVMAAYIEQAKGAQPVPAVTLAWQGGEPTLMGLDFFRRAREVEKDVLPEGTQVERTMQTNGVLLDEEWAEFLAENQYLVGLSIDGPRDIHDAFRHDRAGNSVFDKVVAAARLLQDKGVEFNILCTVNSVNSERPLEVYRFFRDELGAKFIQFIPIVEIDEPAHDGELATVTDRTVRPEQYGRFLCEIFDEWVRNDVGEMFIQFFDGVLGAYVNGISSLCILRPTCGEGVALEHNGDLYSCDHFVDPEYRLGNILETSIDELSHSEQQKSFGEAKADLPQYCRECRYVPACNGECPKNRIILTPDGEPGLNWLCAGLKEFFAHTERRMLIMANLLRQGRIAPEIMDYFEWAEANTGRNDPCPCGSGEKFKKCCGVGTQS
jgi:uncharacterized protein